MSRKLTTNECLSLLRGCDNFLLLTHRGPDGDTVGSAAALCLMLREMGKTAYLLENPEITAGLSNYTVGLIADESYTPGCVVAVDIADPKLLPRNALGYACDLCIDHHASNRMFAKNTLLDCAAACGEVIFDLLRAAEIRLSQRIAACLYLAISTDTGCFRYASVTAKTMRIGADCIEAGVDFYAINREFLEVRSRKRIEVESAALQRCRFSPDGRLAYVWFDHDLLSDFNASDEEMSLIATLLRSIEGVDLAFFMREKTPGFWRISSRSDPSINSGKIMAHLGGGGHQCAAGGSMELSVERLLDAVLEAVSAETDIEAR